MADHLDPQPPPKPGRGDVWLDVMRSISPSYIHARTAPDGETAYTLSRLAPPVSERVRSLRFLLFVDMGERRAQGLARYGTPLQYDNGRDHWTDAYQEFLDGVAYLHAARAPWWMRWASILFAALVRRHVTTEPR